MVGREHEKQKSEAVTSAVDDVFGAVCAARHHEKCGRYQGPDGELRYFLLSGRNRPGGKLGWQGDGAQFFVASSVSDPRSLNAAQVERVRLSQLKNTEIHARCKRKRGRVRKKICGRAPLGLCQRSSWI